MAKLFESTWKSGYKYYERVYDTVLNKSVTKEITTPAEWYEESRTGLYTAILDSSIKLEKKQGFSKTARQEYGYLEPSYRNIRDNYWRKDSYNLEPRIWWFDIETRSGVNSSGFPSPNKALEEICMFQILDNKLDTVIMLGLREWKHKDNYEFELPVKYVYYDSEIELIEAFLNLFEKCDPLILEAWFGLGFDYPYIYNRMKRLGFDVNRLSNHGDVSYSESEFKGQLTYNVSSDGHFFLDLKDVYTKFVLAPRPDYKLDTIAEIEVKENKVNHDEYATFDNFYTGKYVIPDYPTEEQRNSLIYKEAIKNGVNDEVKELAHSEFCYYSYKDPLLLKKIDEKLNLTNIMIMISEKMGVVVSDTLGTVKPWSQYIANKSYLTKEVMPKRTEHDHPKVVGGYVRKPEQGKKEWLLSADVTSMYPLLGMVGFNMSPETYVAIKDLPADLRDIVLSFFPDQDESKLLDYSDDVWNTITATIKSHNVSLGINGAVFKQDHTGMVPELVNEIYNTRKQAKQTMGSYQQRKVLISDIIKERS